MRRRHLRSPFLFPVSTSVHLRYDSLMERGEVSQLSPDEMIVLEQFLAATVYRDPVDLKKLRFIFSSLSQCANAMGKDLRDLTVMEVGCGVGGITLPLATLGCQVYASDIDDADLDVLRDLVKAQALNNVTVAREDALTFSHDRRYDVIIASEVFEHVLEPSALAENLARHMDPGARLIVTTPNGYGPWEMVNSLRLIPRRWNWLRKIAGKPPHDGGGREHEQRYTRERLEQIIIAAGMDRVAFAKSDFIFTTVRALRRHRVTGTLDTMLADVLPDWAVSGWYMVFRR